MAEESKQGSALPADKILVLVCIYLVTLSLSLLGSGSILAMAVRRRQCCCDQLRPLVLLSLADFLGAAVLIPTMALHLLPTQHFGAAHGFCLYGRMFGMMFYAISLLMVLVYACEVNQAVRGWRVTQEDSSYCPRFQLALPYTLAWLLPCLVVLALIVLSSRPLSSEAFLQPLPQAGMDSSGASNLSCSSCLILIHLSHNSCYKAPRQPSPPLASQHSRKDSSIFFLVFLALVVSACVGEEMAMPVPPRAAERGFCQQKPCHPQLPAGPRVLLDASLPPGGAIIHPPAALHPFSSLGGHGPDCPPPGLPAQPGLWLVEEQLPPGGCG
ncbi:uncharacterized protein LOC117672981 isoform X2 [Pantherophis guttatus]|uniref:Uncharacterized protein LOC117672981 isoform X2 n=1 Tax=Pantherophis guttatus TaxID=94885 RepID=A0A6P9D2V9_PANGU|nr:uncharacterized protein LOC117672981 isoform X2 [Pantherophis guttatus]